MEHLISSRKSKNRKRKSYNKTRKNIKKLFEQLRNESNVSINSAGNDSVIVLDKTTVAQEESLSHGKNKTLKKRYGNLIIIDDDEETEGNIVSCNKTPKKTHSCPINCSTPISNLNNNNTLKDMNILNLSNVNTSFNLENKVNNEINDLTKDINGDSYITIDLTSESNFSQRSCSTVIDLANATDSQDCLFITGNDSMSGDSNVTILPKRKVKKANQRKLRKVAEKISELNATDKGRLLELITETIFNGCKIPNNLKNNQNILKEVESRATETAEDMYIKEVIIGKNASRNSIGSNIYNPEKDVRNKTGLRMIVIDGSNVAMQHGRGKVFSVKGLRICVDYFLKRGHIVKAFVPRFRCKFGKSTNPRQLDDMEKQGLVVYTPSREIQGRMVSSYDDRYIVQCAAEFDGVIVSGDNYRDLLQENPRWRFIIENRLLQFTWVNDMIMFPKDPLGRNGPTLENFLKHPTV